MPLDPLTTRLLASSQGDTEAFAELYDAVAPRLFGMVQRILRDAHQSEEVAQEAFLQIWETADRFDPRRGTALTWMLTLAHRRAVDRVRSSDASRRRDTAHVVRSREVPFDETAAAAHASLDGERVRAALERLPTTQRQAVELAYFGGHTHSEVSRLLEVPLGTAKGRIRDGLLRLRELLCIADGLPTMSAVEVPA